MLRLCKLNQPTRDLRRRVADRRVATSCVVQSTSISKHIYEAVEILLAVLSCCLVWLLNDNDAAHRMAQTQQRSAAHARTHAQGWTRWKGCSIMDT